MSSFQLQGDVLQSTLTVAGLTQSMVRICTSDGVTEYTIRFLDALGARYVVSPFLAGEIRSVCMEGRETLIANLKIAVGWRKNDTAALLAQSAGGLSFLAFFAAASEIFSTKQMVLAINVMAETELPSHLTPPGGRELEDCLRALEPRLATFGFGRRLATVLTSIRRSFFAIGVATMEYFSEEISSLSLPVEGRDAVGVIKALLSPERLGDRCLMFRGISGMGWVTAAAIWWRGESSVTLISNGQYLLESAKPSVVIYIDTGVTHKSVIYWYEGRLESVGEILPKGVGGPRCVTFGMRPVELRFPIQGLTTSVLDYRGFPLDCQRPIASLVADFVWDLVHHIDVLSRYCCSPSKSLMKFLGPDAALVVSRTLSTTCGTRPARSPDNPGLAMEALHERMWQALHTSACFGDCQAKGICPVVDRELGVIKQTFAAILVLLFIDADQDLCIPLVDSGQLVEFESLLGIHPGAHRGGFDYHSLGAGACPQLEVNTLLVKITSLLGTIRNHFAASGMGPYPVLVDSYIGSAGRGMCSYLAAAANPSISGGTLPRITVAQGAFIYRDQYYSEVAGEDPAFLHPRVQKSEEISGLNVSSSVIDPSCGILKSSEVTVRDDSDCLYIKIKVEDFFNNSRYINLPRAVCSAALAKEVEGCLHPPETSLVVKSRSLVNLILGENGRMPVLSVACPGPSPRDQFVVMAVLGSSPSALFSSDVCGMLGRPILICRDACLDCGLAGITRGAIEPGPPAFLPEFAGGAVLVMS